MHPTLLLVHPALKSKRQKCPLIYLKIFCAPSSPFSRCDCVFSFFRPFFFFFFSTSLAAQPFSFMPLCRSSSSPLILHAWWCLLLQSPWFCAFRRHCRGKLCSPSPWCVSVSIVIGVHFVWLLLICIGFELIPTRHRSHSLFVVSQ